MNVYAYDRAAAVEYARKWALGRNPKFYDFNDIGGDCTNFASQCIYAGCGVMNYLPLYGWFYRSASDRTPSWTGVEFLHNFLIGNDGMGPFAEITPLGKAEIGDVIQLGDENGNFYHSPVVVGIEPSANRKITENDILIAAHTYDSLDRVLSSYNAARYRVLHISGYRK
ncbi:MAG: amidase domain-containing protein [Clostridiales bacterium]|nr:amidase domain-containing protein [Clostridiales bacterium]